MHSHQIVDAVIVGNLVGVDALAGVAAVLPVVVGVQFVSRLVFRWSGCLLAKCQGQVEPDKARRVVGLSMLTRVPPRSSFAIRVSRGMSLTRRCR